MKTKYTTQKSPLPRNFCGVYSLTRSLTVEEVKKLGKILDINIHGVHGEPLGSINHKGYFCDRWEAVMIEPRAIYFNPDFKSYVSLFIEELT